MDKLDKVVNRKLIFKCGCACNCGIGLPPFDILKPLRDITPPDSDELTTVTTGSYTNSPENNKNVVFIGQLEIYGEPESCKYDQNRRQRINWSFTNARYRQIVRENEILLKKIMINSKVRSLDKLTNDIKSLQSSAAVNRFRMQQQIRRDNQILLKKILEVKPTLNCISRRTNEIVL
ncbi:uncharacterized protein [Rhodnius prolixus]|uniref:uncharacterized protein n=1 Tax=Rhodnius prolixus TaxID=13249 RepID=UPI003D18D4EB